MCEPSKLQDLGVNQARCRRHHQGRSRTGGLGAILTKPVVGVKGNSSLHQGLRVVAPHEKTLKGEEPDSLSAGLDRRKTGIRS